MLDFLSAPHTNRQTEGASAFGGAIQPRLDWGLSALDKLLEIGHILASDRPGTSVLAGERPGTCRRQARYQKH